MLMVFCISAYGDYYPPIPLQYRLHWSPYAQGLVGGEYRYKPYDLKYNTVGLTSRLMRYSPYAFQYDKSGLVSYGEKYSPYAFNYGSNGLVPHYTQYSPYLFSYKNPGLISYQGYGCSEGCGSSPINVLIQDTSGYYSMENSMIVNSSDYSETLRKKEAEDRKAAIEERMVQIKKNEQEKAEDPSEAIRQVLKSKNIKFKTSNSLKIDGKTISVSFVIEDANMIIKFWNSKEISEIAQNDDYRKNIYQNHLKSWEDYCLKYIGNTKKIYNIISGDRQELFNQLQDSVLNSDDTLYAKLQN